MIAQDIIDMHCARAANELELARAARFPAAANAHFVLSRLHLSRAQAMSGPRPRPEDSPLSWVCDAIAPALAEPRSAELNKMETVAFRFGAS